MSVIAHSIPYGLRVVGEKLLAVPKPIAVMRSPVDGVAFMCRG